MKKLTALVLSALLALGLAATAMAGIVETVKEKGELTFMTATGFPPFEYLGTDGTPAGVDIDLAQLVADELGVKLVKLDMNFNLLIEALKSGKGEIVGAGMTITEERASQINFTIPYILNGQALLIRKGSDIKDVNDIKDKIVCVQESTTGHIYVQEKLGLQPMAFLNSIECAGAIMGGKADVCVLDLVPCLTLAAAHPDELEVVEKLLTEEEFALAIAKGNEDLLEITNKVLKKAMEDGTIDAIMEKHIKICSEG